MRPGDPLRHFTRTGDTTRTARGATRTAVRRGAEGAGHAGRQAVRVLRARGGPVAPVAEGGREVAEGVRTAAIDRPGRSAAVHLYDNRVSQPFHNARLDVIVNTVRHTAR